MPPEPVERIAAVEAKIDMILERQESFGKDLKDIVQKVTLMEGEKRGTTWVGHAVSGALGAAASLGLVWHRLFGQGTP